MEDVGGRIPEGWEELPVVPDSPKYAIGVLGVGRIATQRQTPA